MLSKVITVKISIEKRSTFLENLRPNNHLLILRFFLISFACQRSGLWIIRTLDSCGGDTFGSIFIFDHRSRSCVFYFCGNDGISIAFRNFYNPGNQRKILRRASGDYF